MDERNTPVSFSGLSGCLWGILGASGMSLLLVVLILLLPLWTRAGMSSNPTSQVTILPAAQATTATQVVPSVPSSPQPQETPPPVAPGEPKNFQIGQLVQVDGTGGDGLRLRADAGLGATINLVAMENEVYEVRQGPQDRDGYRWWYLVNPYDNAQEGWAVDTYLASLTGP